MGKYDDGYGSYEEDDQKSAYRHKRSVYGYGGDSYGKSYSTYSSYQPSYRHKREATLDRVESLREGQSFCGDCRQCKACRRNSVCNGAEFSRFCQNWPECSGACGLGDILK